MQGIGIKPHDIGSQRIRAPAINIDVTVTEGLRARSVGRFAILYYGCYTTDRQRAAVTFVDRQRAALNFAD